MAEYSIKELEKLSGIKAHTIRIWEKRYKLISPKRSSTNIRSYSDSYLKKIINVAIVNNSGVKISHIARLPASELVKLVHQHNESGEDIASPIDKLTMATVDMNELGFKRVINKLEAFMSFEKIVLSVLYPFLEKIGVLWQTGEVTPAQEHFVSNLIRQKIFVAIDNLPLPNDNSHRVVLFLPENEYHEIGLLFYHYLVRKMGYVSLYLGQSVPYEDLEAVVNVHKPKYIITSIVTTLHEGDVRGYVNRLSKDFSKQIMLVSGMVTQKFDFSSLKNVHRFSSALELKKIL